MQKIVILCYVNNAGILVKTYYKNTSDGIENR